MHETDLVTMRISLSGWFDTGSTDYDMRLARHHYAPEEPVSKRLSAAEELTRYSGTLFLNEQTQDDLTRWSLKLIDHYATSMLLP